MTATSNDLPDTLPRTALVTGAGARLGRAIAAALGEDGFAVAIHYNGSAKGAEETAAVIRAAGGRAAVVQADLSDPAAAKSLLAEAEAVIGPVGVLANSASAFDKDALGDLSPATFRKLLDVNALAPVLLTQAFAKRLPAAATGVVVNMLDVQLAAPSHAFFSYSCSKAALEIATRMSALELAPRIRVNGVAPGLVLRSGAQTQEGYLARQALTPMGQGLGPADIVRAVRYLIRSPHVTGEVMAVDSGQSLLGFGNSRISGKALD